MRGASSRWTCCWVLAAVVCISCGQAEEGRLSQPLARLQQDVSEWTGSMSISRSTATATRLADGRVLVVGGESSSAGYLRSAELYNPATGSWTLTGNTLTARYEARDVLLDNGRVLVVGGGGVTNQTSLAELYNPATGTWSVAGSLNKGRNSHSIAKLVDGRVMVVGGYGSNYSGALKSVEIYNPATDFWTQAAPTLYAPVWA